MNRKLYRDEHQKVIGGVCSGLAQYFDVDVTVVRLLFAFTFFMMGAGLGTYIILWIVLPRKSYPYPNNFGNPTVDYTVPPQQQSNPFGSNPFGNSPVESIRPKQRSHAGIIIGTVLIFIGAAILIDEYDLIPDFDFFRMWPAVLILVGAALVVSGQKAQIWHHTDWKKDDNNLSDAGETTTV